MPPRVTFEEAKFWSIFGLWAIIFPLNMLEVNQRLCRCGFWPSFQLNFESKKRPIGTAPRARQRWPKQHKNTLLVTLPPEKLKPKMKNFFFQFWRQDLLNLLRLVNRQAGRLKRCSDTQKIVAWPTVMKPAVVSQ